jgi:hypothetical protein
MFLIDHDIGYLDWLNGFLPQFYYIEHFYRQFELKKPGMYVYIPGLLLTNKDFLICSTIYY